MGALESILPRELTERALSLADDTGHGSQELVLPYAEALKAISFASGHAIAILGLESFHVRKDGLQTISYTGYDRRLRFAGDWRRYVEMMNREAEKWLNEHRLGEEHGYVLTSASKQEFDDLKR